MADFHPHWRTTDDASAPEAATPRVQAVQGIPEGAVTVSRRPAAIVGIFIVIAIGYMLVQGVGGLLGQLNAGDPVVIRITEQGFVPATVTVKPGQIMIWKNEDAIPHIIYSDKLRNEKNEPVQTSPIFKGSEAKVQLLSTLQPGDYEFGSRTKTDWKGKAVIAAPIPSSSSVSSAPAAPASSSAFSIPAAASSVAAAPASQAASSQAPVQASSAAVSSQDDLLRAPLPVLPDVSNPPPGGIPENPFTVSSPVTTNVAAQVAASTLPKAPLMQQTVTKPVSQPESGPGFVWVIGIVSAVALLAVTRNAFRA